MTWGLLQQSIAQGWLVSFMTISTWTEVENLCIPLSCFAFRYHSVIYYSCYAFRVRSMLSAYRSFRQVWHSSAQPSEGGRTHSIFFTNARCYWPTVSLAIPLLKVCMRQVCISFARHVRSFPMNSYVGQLWNAQVAPFREIPCHGAQSLENASAFASAYQVGKLEAGACTNLLTQVSTEIRTELKELVRPGHAHSRFQRI